jgi:tRNA G10  N-methylase Trm11
MWKYYRHIFKSAGLDTCAFFVRKIVMAVSVLLLVGFTWRFCATSFDFFRSIGIPRLCYGVVLGGRFIISLVRAPVLLDEEQAKEIGRPNLKVQETDDAEKIRSNKKKIEGTLGGLVHEGRNCLINWKDVERRENFQITSMKRKNGK